MIAKRREKYSISMFINLLEMVKEFTGKQIAILGFGMEGQSTLQFLRVHGVGDEQITILDKKMIEWVPATVRTVFGSDYLNELNQYDLIFKAPGLTKHMIETEIWPTDIDRSRFTSQTQYFFDNYKGTIIGVTGTKGKSTTASLIQEMLVHAWKNSLLVGNVGKPVLDEVDFTNPPEIIVYELSSYMIDALQDFEVDIAIFTSLASTHTVEHGGYDAYIRAKFRLLEHAKHLLIGAQVKEAAGDHPAFISATAGKEIKRYGQEGIYTFEDGSFKKNSEKLFADEWMQLLGMHNRYNACALIGICDILWLPYNSLIEALHSFGWLEHRIEFVGTYKGIHWYNDAIATTPQATIAAIDTFGEKLGTIFLGGIEGEYKFGVLVEKLRTYNVKNIVLFPDTWARIKSLLKEWEFTLFETRSMEEAVRFAAENTSADKVALLSCGSPSFSLWSGYKEKWVQFKKFVQAVS